MTDLKERVLDYISRQPDTSFRELELEFESAGKRVLLVGPNIVAWAGLGDALADALIALMAEGQIELNPCSFFTYLYDGVQLGYPIAKRPPAKGYTAPHWLPLVVNRRRAER